MFSSADFQDKDSATELLSGLANKANVIAGQLFNRDGQLFASYNRSSGQSSPFKFDPTTEKSFHQFRFNLLFLLQPVTFKGEQIGCLSIERNLTDMQRNMAQFTTYWAIIAFLAWLLSIWLSSRFKRIVSGPIEQLNQTMKSVSTRKNYRLRVENTGNDELGQLALGFNEMLAQIELRDSELTLHRDHMEHLAHHDALTGLPNRLLLDDRLTNAIQRSARAKNELAVMFLDLDRFKNINDTLGHDVGDMILIEVAHRLEKTLRKMDTVARLGGDEFVVIVEDFDSQEKVLNIANKISTSLTESFQIFEHQLFITVSIGITFYPRDGVDLNTLKRCADIAMYQAKEGGRDNYRIYSPEMGDELQRRVKIDKELRIALEQDQLDIHFQPQVSMKTGRLVGVEALVRWIHPERGMIPPDQFIYLAEESGIILKLGEWVMRETCLRAQKWLTKGLGPLVFAVNVSSKQFHQDDLVKTVCSILEETGFPPHLLELGVTETALMEDIEGSTIKMRELQKIGVSVAIDDFGSGYSSLSYLKHFPIRKIKIDRNFIRDLSRNHNDKAIAASVASMARIMGLEALAEGVETAEQERILLMLGIEMAQGFLYEKPMEQNQFETFLKQTEIQTKVHREGGDALLFAEPIERQRQNLPQKALTVLAVCSNRSFQEQILLILNRMNFDIVPISNQQDIASITQAIKPELILLEITPDELARFKTIRENKELAETPLIVITKPTDVVAAELLADLGCLDVLTLPLRAGDLYQALGRCNIFDGHSRNKIRANFTVDIEVDITGQTSIARGTTLSEGGIFVTDLPALEPESELLIRLPMESGRQLELKGLVLYTKTAGDGTLGTAIKFQDLSRKQSRIVHAKVSDLLIGDIIREQESHFFVL